MSGQLRKPDMPEDSEGEPLYLRRVEAAVAKDASSVTTGTANDITLNVKTKFVSISVVDYPVYLRAQATASSSNFDLYLVKGQHDLVLGDSVTVISTIAHGGTAYVVTIEKDKI